jgi:molecular chaperone GrpE
MDDMMDNMTKDTTMDAQAETTDPLVEAQAKAEEYLAGWKRATADYANLKRESERAREEFGKYAAAALVNELLPVYDNLRKALMQRPADKWADGIAHVASQFEKTLRDSGVAAIEETGVPFDPVRHEAMLTETHEGVASGTVVKVLESGYLLHEKVLRPAKVTVAE